MKKSVLNEDTMLRNGVKIPSLGFGTWFLDDDKAKDAVKEALTVGYRHIDTTEAYRNEVGVGEGIRASGKRREEVFVTTKLLAEAKTYDSAKEAIESSLRKLNVGAIDLMIIHSPEPWNDFRGGDYAEGNREAWRALEDYYLSGKLRAIGVSNFQKKDLENLFTSCRVPPMVNQILVHIGRVPTELIDFCKENQIVVEAYSPIAHGEMFKRKEVAEIAEKHHVSVSRLAIRFDFQLGLIPLPKASNPDHMRENADIDFEIEEKDMKTLLSLKPFEDYGEFTHFPVFSGK